MKHITATNSEIEHKISEKIHSDRDRRILRLRLIDGLTFEKIGEEMQMSPRYLRTLVKRLTPILEIS